MINKYNDKKFINKKDLAEYAGVSSRTFSRYLKTRREILAQLGVSPYAQKLSPRAVRYVCEDYCIDLPESLMQEIPFKHTKFV